MRPAPRRLTGLLAVCIWFAAASVVLVAFVFRSPAIDQRSVIVGSLLPLVEIPFGRPGPLHSVVGAVALLVLVVAATQGRRVLRRRLLGVPIGVMCHLVLDGSFTRTGSFWWPITHLPAGTGVPEVSHLTASLVLEVVGIGVAVWAWGLFGLRDAARLERFRRDGRLELPEGAS